MQYFTPDDVVAACLSRLRKWIPDDAHVRYIEPAAGGGAFVARLPRERTIAYDVDRALCEAHQYTHVPASAGGFLCVRPEHMPASHSDRRHVVVVGNPPFARPRAGRHGRVHNFALDFVNHSAALARTCAMIVGANFARASVQQQVRAPYALVDAVDLGKVGWRVDGRQRSVRCHFMVWQDGTTCAAAMATPLLPRVVDGCWGGDFTFLRPTDSRANILVKRWGAVGRVCVNPAEVRKAVIAEVEKQSKRRSDPRYGARYVTGRTCAPDFFLHALDVSRTAARLERARSALQQEVRDKTAGNNPSIRMGHLVLAYVNAGER